MNEFIAEHTIECALAAGAAIIAAGHILAWALGLAVKLFDRVKP